MTVNQIFNQFLLLGTVALGLVGCTGEKLFSDTSKTEESDSFGKISISVKTPLSEKYLVTRAIGDKIAAEPDEAKVNNLKVYLFTKDGANGTEDDYVLYKDYDFDNSKIKNIAGNSQVSIAIEPDLMGKTVKAVIIANDSPVLTITPRSTKLTEFRKALASATVTTRSESDALVGGANKSFPMSCVTSDIAKLTPMGVEVNAVLVRSMARIDILNFAKDLVIKSVKLTNVDNKSYLLSSGTGNGLNVVPAGSRTKIELQPLKEYSEKIGTNGLAYDSSADATGEQAAKNANKHRTFYLYEQEVKDKATSPMVTIEYVAKNTKVEKKGKIEVVFQKSPAPNDWVNVKRNHIYTIQLGEFGKSVLQGKVKVRFVVDDWNEVTVPSEIDPTAIPDYSATAVGDFMLSNGHTIKPADVTASNQKDVIGVVAYLYKTESNARLKEGVKNALKAKGVAEPHGLVMALKNASTSAEWRTSNTQFGELKGTWKDSYADGADGYTLTTNVWKANKPDEFPAFKATKEFGTKVNAPVNTTDWYIPSAGEWIDILGDKGLQAISKSITDEAKNLNENYKYWSGEATRAFPILNQKMNKVGASNFDAFALGQVYWSSSEYSSDYAYRVYFLSDGGFYYSYSDRTDTYYVRPIFAF